MVVVMGMKTPLSIWNGILKPPSAPPSRTPTTVNSRPSARTCCPRTSSAPRRRRAAATSAPITAQYSLRSKSDTNRPLAIFSLARPAKDSVTPTIGPSSSFLPP